MPYKLLWRNVTGQIIQSGDQLAIGADTKHGKRRPIQGVEIWARSVPLQRMRNQCIPPAKHMMMIPATSVDTSG